jgi:kumamolisin
MVLTAPNNTIKEETDLPFEKRVALRGSQRSPVRDAQEIGPVPADERLQVSVILARRGGRSPHEQGVTPPRVSYAQFAEEFGASSEAVAKVERFAHHAGLTVVESNAAKRRVLLSGSAHAITQAFGTKVARCRLRKTDTQTYRVRSGALTVPAEVENEVIAVLGIDNRPVAKAQFRRARAVSTSYTPPQIASLYGFPTGVNGSGQTVGIVELGGGYQASDLQTYFSQLNVAEPSVTEVSVDGGANSPGSDADGEVMLDIEMIGSIAPGANIAVYFAPNTDQGFIDAITDAVHDTARKISVISISWGGPEDSWTQQSQTAMNAALQDAATLGVTVTVAAGDNGSSDGETDGKLHVDFPASSPYALACGGTTLTASGSQISSEVVWNESSNQEGATGGGVSTAFALPSYQSSAKIPAQPETNFVGRGVPDISGNADPSTGYNIRVDGQDEVVGGTSAVAPLWAALVALLNQQLGSPVGYLNPKLYPLGESAFRDITSGNNDDNGLGYYSAETGWDACTGLGSPNGTALLAALQSK